MEVLPTQKQQLVGLLLGWRNAQRSILRKEDTHVLPFSVFSLSSSFRGRSASGYDSWPRNNRCQAVKRPVMPPFSSISPDSPWNRGSGCSIVMDRKPVQKG